MGKEEIGKMVTVVRRRTECTDRGTGLKGTVTHWFCGMGGAFEYLFQPQGINRETGQPVRKLQLEVERLEGLRPEDFETIEIPFGILGSIVTDKASGFTGMATGIVQHTNGCLHLTVQPPGVLEKTNSPINFCEFDIRDCRGEKIPVLTEEERAESEREKPSPSGDGFEGHFSEERPSTFG